LIFYRFDKKEKKQEGEDFKIHGLKFGLISFKNRTDTIQIFQVSFPKKRHKSNFWKNQVSNSKGIFPWEPSFDSIESSVTSRKTTYSDMARKSILGLVFLFVFSLRSSFCQEIESNEGLSFSNTSRKIENLLQMELAPRDMERMGEISGQKASFKAKSLNINGELTEPEDIHSRGQTTLSFPRKSLSIDLAKSADFHRGENKAHLKHFILLSLAMDKFYIRNRLAFGMMEELDLLNFFYTYADLEINGNSQGIFFLVERPQDWAIHEANSPLVIRRGYGHSIQKSKSAKTLSKSESKSYLDSFKSIYHLIANESGSELYESLTQKIDLENYMRWMAFNFLVKNGDYADEVFFYIDPKTGLFKIIPWDYDDIFSAFPHEGHEAHLKDNTPFIFSKEDDLDRKIAEDEFLYEKYLNVLKEVSETLSSSKLKSLFEETFAELYPYYSQPGIIQNVKKDLYPDVDLDKLQVELASDFLLIQGGQKLIPRN